MWTSVYRTRPLQRLLPRAAILTRTLIRRPPPNPSEASNGSGQRPAAGGISFLPPEEGDNVYDWAFDQISRDSSTKQPVNDISCTVLDEHGKVVGVSRKYARKDFLGLHNLHPRDLRNIDSRLIPSILVRNDCILVNMLELRAAIRHNEVLIFDSVNSDNKALIAKLSLLVYDLENKLGSSLNHDFNGFSASQSYELKALESILMHAVSSLDIELKEQLSVLNGILVRLEDHIDRDLLKELLVRNRAMSLFYQKILLVRNVISELLDNDEDLVSLYLTEKFNGVDRDPTDHAEVELLLEAYYKQLDEIVQQAEQVISNVKSTEEIINIMLDANRNSLMLFELKITIGTLGTTVGMFFAALYGMNLKNFIEESEYGFVGSVAVITAVSALVTYFNFKKLAIVKRVTLIGHGSSISDNSLRRRALQERMLHGKAQQRLHASPQYPRKRFWFFGRKKNLNEYDQHKRAIMWRWLVEKRDT